MACLQIGILLIRQRHGCSLLHLLLISIHKLSINLHLRRCKGRSCNKLKSRVSNKLSSEPQKGLLKVVVGFGRNVVVLQVLLAVECNALGLDLALLDINLVSAKNNGNVLAHSDKITVPVGHTLVCDTRGNIKHNDSALAVDVVSVSQSSKLLLSCSVPHLKLNLTIVGVESQGVHFNSLSGIVSLFKLSSQVALDEGGLVSMVFSFFILLVLLRFIFDFGYVHYVANTLGTCFCRTRRVDWTNVVSDMQFDPVLIHPMRTPVCYAHDHRLRQWPCHWAFSAK